MMNKGLLKYIIPSLTLAVGIVFAAVGFSMGAKEAYINQLNLTNIEAVIASDNVASIDINIAYADLEISASNDVSDFEISAENISREYLNYSASNNILNLKYTTNKWYEIISVPGLTKKTGKIKITVPADKMFQDIQIKSGLGVTSVNYLTAENLYINCGSGNNSINSINADYIEITNGSGNISAENITSEELSFSGGSGKTDILNFQTEKANFNTGIGSMKLSGIIEGDSSIKCGIGNIKADLCGNKDDYSIYIPKGNAKINGKNSSETTSGKYNMDIIVGMGNIDINFK